MDEEFEIQEQLPEIMEEEGFNLEFAESENASIEIGNSTVKLKKHQIEIGKKGAHLMNQPTQVITPFQINPDCIEEVRKIGKGSAGLVWLAKYFFNGETHEVAIKEIPIDTKESRDQFVNDLKVFLQSDNPNIVRFYGCFYREGLLSEVIQYMNLGSLRNVIQFNAQKKYALNQEILAQLCECILNGLLYIHKKKHQIHRDIKPENILINSEGQVKITDFGISKQLEKTYGLSHTWCGTFIYMSPERVEGKPYSSNCDVWSFGLVLYELATSRPLPYYRANKAQPQYLIIKKIKGQPVPTFLPEDNRSGEMQNFLSRCLQKTTESRAHVQELLSHPWLQNNLKKQRQLKHFMKCLGKSMNK